VQLLNPHILLLHAERIFCAYGKLQQHYVGGCKIASKINHNQQRWQVGNLRRRVVGASHFLAISLTPGFSPVAGEPNRPKPQLSCHKKAQKAHQS